MIKIDNIEVVGWEHVIRGMRNPKNSWDKSDSCTQGSVWCNEFCGEPISGCDKESGLHLGPNDHKLMMDLAKGGPVHAKYRRMIVVYMDITAPLYWWKEFDTYKVGTVANSCSTMHKIHAKEFELGDFSIENLDPFYLKQFEYIVNSLNQMRDAYNKRLDIEKERKCVITDIHKKQKKMHWYSMIQLLPTSYNQKRTVMLNYEVLTNIYHSRKNHKLDEWHVFCDEIEKLPYSEIIIGGKE